MSLKPEQSLLEAVCQNANPLGKTSLDELMDWQGKLRDSVDKLIAHEIRSPFLNEMKNRIADGSLESKKEGAKWANTILRECRLSIRFPDSDKTSFFTASSERGSLTGRLRLESLGPTRHQMSSRVDEKLDSLELVAEHRLPSPFATRNISR